MLDELEQRAFSTDRISLRSWRRLLRSPSATVSVALQADRIVGATVLLHRVNTSVARLYSIAVCPAVRQRGTARQLLDNVLVVAREVGATLLRLETRVDNTAAQKLFASYGFVHLRRKTSYYADGMGALQMQKPLVDEKTVPALVSRQAPSMHKPLTSPAVPVPC